MSKQEEPVIVGRFRNPITDPAEVYSGCYGRAAINFYGYNSNGKKGISAGPAFQSRSSTMASPSEPVGSADDFADDFKDDDDDFLGDVPF